MILNIHKIKVYNYFWIFALIHFLIGLTVFSDPNATLDINVHDFYIVVAHFHIALLLCLSYFLLGLGYWLILKIFKKKLIKWLTIIHSAILIGSFMGYWILILGYKFLVAYTTFPLSESNTIINIYLLISLLLIIFIAQPIYVVNLLIGIFRKEIRTIEPNHKLNEKT